MWRRVHRRDAEYAEIRFSRRPQRLRGESSVSFLTFMFVMVS